jgi:DNA helicase II / ATP-dependent DNA helicase PcrA
MPFLDELNKAQREAVITVNGPLMVVAGPGSGKTRVLTYRIAQLLNIGVPDYQILALTFTNKAASEMKERVIKLTGSRNARLLMGTFHSVFARLLRSESHKLGFGKNYSIYDEGDSLRLIKNIMGLRGISAQQYNPNAIRSRISTVKNQLIDPKSYADKAIDAFEEKTAEIYHEYQKRLQQNNAMDFDDLLLKPIELFASQKNILTHYQDRFRFILIDEYQDTNLVQYVMIKHLAEKYRNICVVGDDAQSIYAFRGADIRNILDFQKDYPEAKVIRLEENYRSTKTILDIADRVIKYNTDQINKNLWTNNEEGEPVTLLTSLNDSGEGDSIADCIMSDINRLKLNFKDFAVMYRTNAQSRAFEEAFRRNNVPYIMVGGTEFYQRKEIKDILAYLRILSNPNDDGSLIRIINYPSRGLGDKTLKYLINYAVRNKLTLLKTIASIDIITTVSPKAKNNILIFYNMLQKYVKLKDTISINELAHSLVDEIGIHKIFKEQNSPEAEDRWGNVLELLASISEYNTNNPNALLEEYLEEISLVTGVDSSDKNCNAVTLMTLHSSKGLEFPVVFIAGLEEGILPLYNSVLEDKELEEERRLFYVGITRAIKKLYFSYVQSRYLYGDTIFSVPSRFIEESGIEPDNNFIFTASHLKNRYSGIKKGRTKIEPPYSNGSGVIKDIEIGAIVEHGLFGKGKVINFSGVGDSLRAIVDFDSAGEKLLLIKYANLKMM